VKKSQKVQSEYLNLLPTTCRIGNVIPATWGILRRVSSPQASMSDWVIARCVQHYISAISADISGIPSRRWREERGWILRAGVNHSPSIARVLGSVPLRATHLCAAVNDFLIERVQMSVPSAIAFFLYCVRLNIKDSKKQLNLEFSKKILRGLWHS